MSGVCDSRAPLRSGATGPAISETWQDLELMAAMMRRRDRSRGGPAQRCAPLQAPDLDLRVDLSCSALSPGALALLGAFAEEGELAARRRALMGGSRQADPGRPGMPGWLLRLPRGARAELEGGDISLEIAAARHWPESLAEAIRDGELSASDGAPFTTVLHLGSAGADPGAEVIAQSLSDGQGPEVIFLRERDGARLRSLMRRLDPRRTAVILVDRDFRGGALRGLARVLCGWLAQGGEVPMRHLFAVTREVEAARAFGVRPERIIGALDLGRAGLSPWSPVQLGLPIALGAEGMRALRAGAHAIDRHFAEAPFAANLPVLLALSDLWHQDLLGHAPAAPLVFDSRLRGWATYVSSSRHGRFGPARGGHGDVADLMIAAEPDDPAWEGYHLSGIAEALALLAQRVAEAEGAGSVPGGRPGRPTVGVIYRRLDLRTLGQLLALSEYRGFALSVLRGPGPAGARGGAPDAAALAEKLEAGLCGAPVPGIDPGLRGLMGSIMALRGAADRAEGPAGRIITFPRGEPAGGVAGRRRG